MVTKGVLKTGLIWLLVICVSGCATPTDLNKVDNLIPDEWSAVVPPDASGCSSINGDYQNLGVGRFKRDEPLAQTRLDVALGHTFPSGKMPKQVNISLEEESNMLNYQFIGPVEQSFKIFTSCSNGWYKLEKRLTNHYLGDGANLDFSNRKVELGRTVEGDLIVHLILEIQSSSFLVLKSRDTVELWSKYEESKHEN